MIWIQPQDQGLHYELVAFVGDRLLLYGYKSGASLPIPDGLIAYDIPTQEKAWRLPSAQLQALHADSIQVALAIEGRTLIQHIRLSDGEPHNAPPQTLHHARTLELPTLYQPKDQYFADFEGFFAAYQKTICWGVEYMEWPGHLGVSFYIAEGKTATHHFWCINDQKSVILSCVLRHNCPGLGQGSFGRVGEVLILPYQPYPDQHALHISQTS